MILRAGSGWGIEGSGEWNLGGLDDSCDVEHKGKLRSFCDLS